MSDEYLAKLLEYEEVYGTASGEIYLELQRWRLIEAILRQHADAREMVDPRECLVILEGE